MTGEKRHVEILAPAGSYESFQAAIAAGADAVYLGGNRFGARAFAQNFSEEELLQAIDYAHLHGRKIYLTVNTLLKEQELRAELSDYLEPFYRQGLDAVIVQDMGVLHFIREQFPDLELHASTQMTVTGALGAAFLKDAGVKRIVPARELSLTEIREMKDQTGLDLECFVHGALCYCYSGQCLLSSLIGGRSGNRGQCAQPCRLPYEYGGEKGCLLSLKDICTLDLIPDLIEAGIDSFKIEGRMKKPEYVAGVTSIYRKYVDLYLEKGRKGFRVEESDREVLMDLYNRGGFHEGYYDTHNGPEMLSRHRPNHAGTPAVRVLSQKGREVRIQAIKPLYKGDILELPGENDNYTLGTDLAEKEISTILVPRKQLLEKGSILNRTRCTFLVEKILQEYGNRKMQEKIYGFLKLFPEKPATLELSCRDCNIMVSGETVQYASSRPLEEERVRRQMEKTGNMPFTFEQLDISMSEECFYPMQQLNMLRRKAAEQLEEAILNGYRRQIPEPVTGTAGAEGSGCYYKKADTGAVSRFPKLAVMLESKEQLEYLSRLSENGRIYIESTLFEKGESVRELIQKCKDQGWEIYPAFPHILRVQAVPGLAELIRKFAEEIDGVLIRNLESIRLLQQTGFDKTIITDHNLYVFNQEAKQFLMEYGVRKFTAPLELNYRELQKMCAEDCELMIYGYEPVMISAQCLEKNCSGCTKRPGYHFLTDRYNKRFSVKNVCDFCYNIIYNSEPLMLFSEAEDIQKLSPESLRLTFTKENSKEMDQIFSWYRNSFLENRPWSLDGQAYTKGHFRRGIK